MNTKNILIIGAIIILGGAGAFFLSNQKTDDVMMDKKNDALIKDEAMQKEETIKDKEAMVEKGADTMMEETGVLGEGDLVMNKGSYETYSPEKLALANKGKVVLFFRASWCPTCRALDADVRANLSNIPGGVIILDVNYDKETTLKQKYGVTYQHTLVQVDALGNQIAKWSNSPTLASLLSSVK